MDMRKTYALGLFTVLMLNKIRKLVQGSDYLKDKVVLITGGSKGLGLVLAEYLIKENCRIAICARDEHELGMARRHLLEHGGEVFTFVCDVSDKAQVESLISAVIEHYGCLDIVVNNAGIISVGPMESFDFKHYESSMEIMYWGMANTTLSVVPYFKTRKEGHIVNVTSVGGKVSIPHLLPYSAAKFAAEGFSEGSASELLKDNIHVTTIVPGLMRTGSYINAIFQEGNKREFKLFSFMSSAPLLTVSAEKAARRIVQAMKEKRTLKIIGLPAKLLIEMNHFFPRTMTKIFSLVSKTIPAVHEKTAFEKGKEITDRRDDAEVPGFRKIGEKAQKDHQLL